MSSPADTRPAAVPVSLYVHVPFCVSKCAYCDFYSVARSVDEPQPRGRESYLPSSDLWDSTLGGAFAEMVLGTLVQWHLPDILTDVPTLYFGGGTPTALGPLLVEILRDIHQPMGFGPRIGLRADAEITVETNPETTERDQVAALSDAGVNRFSLGVQSFDDEVLRTLGRCHDAARALEATAILRASGRPFSIDLICGVPGQSFESWEATLERAVDCGARHVSVYPLSVETGTPMAAAVAEGRMPAPDPDVAADMMLAADVALSAAGMPRYEVANYAQPGHESHHNLAYWTGGAYLGLGPGAASMLPEAVYRASGLEIAGRGKVPRREAGGRVRFKLEADLDAYLRDGMDTVDPEAEYLTVGEAAREDVMLGLRLTAGVPASQVAAAGLTDVLAGLRDRGLVRLVENGSGPSWRTTERGWLLGNEVFGAVWTAE